MINDKCTYIATYVYNIRRFLALNTCHNSYFIYAIKPLGFFLSQDTKSICPF